MTTQITHRLDPDTKHYRQVVSPAELRRVLEAEGSDHTPPPDFGPDDEWRIEDEGLSTRLSAC